MFYFNPILMLIGLLLMFLPQLWVKSTYKKFAEVPSNSGLSGMEVARGILADAGLTDISIEETSGELSDHYDPQAKAVRLSQAIYRGRSLSSAAIAAHECGHAIQHARGYSAVAIRGALVPVVNLGSNLGPIMMMIGLSMMYGQQAAPHFAIQIAWMGAILFGAVVLFQLVTLPVEIDASTRAVRILAGADGKQYLSPEEMPAAKKVLTAAACTYVAAALYSAIQLAYFVMQIMGAGRNRD